MDRREFLSTSAAAGASLWLQACATTEPERPANPMDDGFTITEQRVELRGISLNCASGPTTGSPMVMLHGITNWWRSFEGAMPVLGARWTVHALDLRGHGHSSRVDEGYRWTEFAQDTVAWLKETQDEPAIVVGHSMGANVAIEVAATITSAIYSFKTGLTNWRKRSRREPPN